MPAARRAEVLENLLFEAGHLRRVYERFERCVVHGVCGFFQVAHVMDMKFVIARCDAGQLGHLFRVVPVNLAKAGVEIRAHRHIAIVGAVRRLALRHQSAPGR